MTRPPIAASVAALLLGGLPPHVGGGYDAAADVTRHPVVDPAAAPMAEAPPAGFTGGFGEPTCVLCHLGNDVNAFGGRVGLEGLPERYEPGREYVLTVDLTAPETALAGFQLTARFNKAENAGALDPVDERTARSDSAGVSYLHQSGVGSIARDADGSAWSFAWTAPRAGGTVTFHLAANSGNGDNSPLSDLVYTHERVVPPAR